MKSAAKKLVILAAAPGGGKVLGGGERFLPDVIPHLLARGWDVTLAAPAGSPLLLQTHWPSTLNVEGLEFPVLERKPLTMIRAAAQFHRFVRKHSDAVFHGNTYRSLKWLAQAKVTANVPTVCHLQESNFAPYYTVRARYLSRLVDEFVAISGAVQREFQKGTGIPSDHFHMIPHGIPIQVPEKSDTARSAFWSQLGLDPDNRIVCMVGRTDPLKGHEVLVEAFARIATQIADVALVMVGIQDISSGEKEIFDRVNMAVQAHGISARVKFVPNIPNAREFMRHADLVVVPSLSEGLGRVAIEGQAEHTCVVASATGGLMDVVEHERTGYLVPPGKPVDLAMALVRLLEDDGLRLELAQAGWESARELFSVERMNCSLENIWLRLLNRPSS